MTKHLECAWHISRARDHVPIKGQQGIAVSHPIFKKTMFELLADFSLSDLTFFILVCRLNNELVSSVSSYAPMTSRRKCA